MSLESERRRALQAFMDARGLNKNAWARAAGVRESGLRAFLNGTTKSLNLETYDRLAMAAGVSVATLLGEPAPATMPPTDARPPSQFDAFELVPVYDAGAAAGPGFANDASPALLCHSAFRLDWLRSRTSAPTDKLAVIRVVGDSNQPMLQHGDNVLIDMTVQRYTRDGLYVIRYASEDEAMVKRVSRDPSSRLLTIQSLNPDYPSWGGVKDDDLFFIGRVLWLGRNIG